jgi:hypothetical protein
MSSSISSFEKHYNSELVEVFADDCIYLFVTWSTAVVEIVIPKIKSYICRTKRWRGFNINWQLHTVLEWGLLPEVGCVYLLCWGRIRCTIYLWAPKLWKKHENAQCHLVFPSVAMPWCWENPLCQKNTNVHNMGNNLLSIAGISKHSPLWWKTLIGE